MWWGWGWGTKVGCFSERVLIPAPSMALVTLSEKGTRHRFVPEDDVLLSLSMTDTLINLGNWSGRWHCMCNTL